MGFLDRFKNKKELEVEKKSAAPSVEAAEKPAVKTTKETSAAKPVKETKAKKESKTTKSSAKKEEPKAKEEKKPSKAARHLSEDLAWVIVKPLVTEKAATLTSLGQYAFVVDKGANRIQVRQAVKELYGIAPTSVRIQNVRAETVRFGRVWGTQKAWKKAIVSLPKGKSIDVYEGV